MNKILIAIFSIFIIGCATPYQKTGLIGGFSETQISQNTWKVTFEGNGYTSAERSEDFALLRCAELTLANGYSYFGLADSKSSSNLKSYTTPRKTYSTGTGYITGNTVNTYVNTTSTGGQTMFFSTPSNSNLVVMFNDKSEYKGFIFDANFICNSVGVKYQITCGLKN